MPPTIVGRPGSRPQNHSGYTFDLDKWSARPGSMKEVDPLRATFHPETHEVVRTYTVSAGEMFDFEEWATGYSNSISTVSPGDVAAAQALAEGVFYYLRAVAPGASSDGHVTYPPGSAPPGLPVKLRRVIPAQDPVRPWLFARSCELIQGHGAWIEDPDSYVFAPGSATPTYLKSITYADINPGLGKDADGKQIFGDGVMRYRVTYGPLDYEVRNDADTDTYGAGEIGRYVIWNDEPSIEAIPLARIGAGVLTFAGTVSPTNPFGGQQVREAGVLQLPSAAVTYHWVDVPDKPVAAFNNCLGKINSSDFDGFSGRPKYPAQTLLCMPWRTRRTKGVTGRVTWQVFYRFLFHPQKWNYYPASNGQFYPAYFADVAGGPANPAKPVYQLADFGQLFAVPPPVTYR